MKNINYIYYICLCLMISWGCEDITPPLNQPQRIAATVTDIGETSARYSVSVDHTDAVSVQGIEYGMDRLLDSYSTNVYREEGTSGQMFNLKSGTTYYYRAYAEDKRSNRIYGNIGSFTTKEKAIAEFGNDITAASSFGGGDGTQSNPYLISDAMQLKKLVDDVNQGNKYQSSYFKLTTDIQVTADEWIPIGTSSAYSFRGIFDGDGHTISGTLKSANYGYFSFFGYIRGATLSNITIAATIKSTNTSYLPSTGGVVGDVSEDNTISNCNVSGSVIGSGAVGGVTGWLSGNNTIHNCNVSGTVTVTEESTSGYIGGIVGFAYLSETNVPGTISNCTVSGSVIGNNEAGGIAGTSRYTITNCTVSASGSVSGRGMTGGIAGSNYGKIHTSLNAANVTSSLSSFTGGLVGSNSGSVYSCCTNNGKVNGQPASSSNQIGYGTSVITCPDGHEKR
jgi:hypothetical protein